ncbi:uncharacterized protein RHIMIDRAFT_137029 [Rhizopus microsporus ATCC 52813]|uniref:RPEL repeat protein n=1 Tax=Rhizopus microsporus ATCC 52813 TaxID=1340429 RepID=A0A2G4SVK8_RHIZD|nr:uncharacterized protein RHIMIDRAFT_137029 [Rhizopus microsporus ATCC 52813]PHZ12774.1 hypothetical protein RHIMIDRAFT_137029 [Rhizopus microsporus ATCC 52813]
MTVPENPAKLLEAQLAHRPDIQDLVERNIIKDPKMDAQEKRRVEESLLHKIDHRPTPEELVQHNILKADPTEVAPALQKNQFELERNMIHDSLENKLHERPDRAKLVEQGILTNDETSK